MIEFTNYSNFSFLKLITPAFHFQILEKFVTVLDTTSEIFANKLDSYVGSEFDLFKLATFYALDSASGKTSSFNIFFLCLLIILLFRMHHGQKTKFSIRIF